MINGSYGRGHSSGSTFVYRDHLIVASGEYDPAGNVWSPLTPLPGPRLSGVARQTGATLYFATGSTSGSTITNTLFRGSFGSSQAEAFAPQLNCLQLLTLSMPVGFPLLRLEAPLAMCSLPECVVEPKASHCMRRPHHDVTGPDPFVCRS